MATQKKPVRRSKAPKGNTLLYICGAAVIVLALVLQMLMPNGFPLSVSRKGEDKGITEIHSKTVRINEIMTSNSASLTDSRRKTPDWIEIANVGKSTLDISGYKLARKANSDVVFTFPQGTRLNSGECLIVFADNTNEQIGDELHAPFSLSASGDTLLLFNTAESAIDTVNIPAMAADQAYIRQDTETWGITRQCTPGLLNTAENYNSLINAQSDGILQIAEIVASNTQYAMTVSGAYYDYIVVRNISGRDFDMSGYHISDDPDKTRKWRVPEGVVIPAGGDIVFYCSGLDCEDASGELHTNFRLRSEGEKIVLSNRLGQAIDITSYDLLKTDTALLRGADGAWAVGTPTK